MIRKWADFQSYKGKAITSLLWDLPRGFSHHRWEDGSIRIMHFPSGESVKITLDGDTIKTIRKEK